MDRARTAVDTSLLEVSKPGGCHQDGFEVVSFLLPPFHRIDGYF